MCLLIDMSVYSDNNFVERAFAKLSKYKDLAIEVEMWQLKTKTILVVVGAFVEKFPRSPLLQEVQKNDPEKYSTCLKRSSLTFNFFISSIFFFFIFLSFSFSLFCTKNAPSIKLSY